MSSFNRRESDGLDRAAHLLVNLAERASNDAPHASVLQNQPAAVSEHKENIPDASGNAEEQVLEAPLLPEPPSNPSVLRKACQVWQLLRSCFKKGFVDVPESLLRSQYKNTADTSKALRQMVQDGLVMRSGAGGKGNPFLYRVSAASLTSQHYAREKVGLHTKKHKSTLFNKRQNPAPAATIPAAVFGLASDGVPSPGAAAPNQAAWHTKSARGDEPKAVPDLAAAGNAPLVKRTKPRSAGMRVPRQITPPEDGRWFVYN